MRFMLIRFSFALFSLFISVFTLNAQEQLGMRLERYSGIYGAGINPANTAFTPHNWEVSLFNADLFAENSFAYLANTSLQNALKNADNIISAADTSQESNLSGNEILQGFYEPGRKMHLIAQARVGGPSFSFRIGENDVVGLTTAFRSHFSSYQIPEILNYFKISDLPRNKAIEIPSTGLSGAAWSEIGLHYSHLMDNDGMQVAWGVSPKLLLGYESFFIRVNSKFDYTQLDGDTVAFGSGNWHYAFTNGNIDAEEGKLRRQGLGMGLDLGISWAMPDEDEESGYRWRAGISLVDLGYIHFRRSAEEHIVKFDKVVNLTDADFPGRDSVEEILQDVSKAFLGSPTASLVSREYSIILPTALSAQFDARVAPMFYVGGLITQRVPLSKNSLKRPSTLAIVPRFEHKWFSASLPLVVNDWRSFRAGAAVRLGWLYLGTDNLGSFTQKDKLSGTDFYIGLKINGFSIHVKEKGYHLNREGGHRSSGPNRRKIKCYSF